MKLLNKNIVLVAVACATTVGCATTQDVQRLESKIDQLLAVQQELTAMEEIFGQQSTEILRQIKTLDGEQLTRFNALQSNYREGQITLVDVRKQMLNVLGNSNRIVTAEKGIYVRNDSGRKINAISKGRQIVDARMLEEAELPENITGSRYLSRYSWGVGVVGEQQVIFPWELTMSTFAKEIVENTARRTAEEFIKMGGGKNWNRPVYIDLTVQNENQLDLSVKENGEEVYINNSIVE